MGEANRNRRLNTGDQQVRLEALHAANANAPGGTPATVIVAEAMVFEEYIKNGANPEQAQLRAMRDVSDAAAIAAGSQPDARRNGSGSQCDRRDA